MAGSLTPLIPILIGAAMFKTVLSILGPDVLGVINAKDHIYILFDMVYNAGFYFLPIYLGYSCAKKLNTNIALGMFMGGILIAPAFVEMATKGTSFTVFGIPTVVYDYSQSVVPMLLSVWVLSHVETFFKKWIPDALSTIFVPFLTMLVMLPLSLSLLAPMGGYISQYISKGLIAFGNVGGFIAIAVIAALWEFLVMSGMHVILVVTLLNVIMTTGQENVIGPAALCATAAASGIALGAFFKLKDKKEKSLSMGYFVSGVIGGVTEPSLYGVGMRYKKPLLTMAIGAGIGGLYTGITHATLYSFGATNFLMVLNYSGSKLSNLINGSIGCLIALFSSAILTYLFGFSNTKNDKSFKACIDGELINQKDIKDETFASGMMGKGVAIIPTNNIITAPCSGEVTVVMENSKHAVGLKLDNGAEILIHEGIDTVNMNGEGFKTFVKVGDHVKCGDKLIQFDIELIKKHGYDPMTVIMLLNASEFENAKFIDAQNVKANKTEILNFGG